MAQSNQSSAYFAIFSQPYRDTITGEYKNILSVSPTPTGPLKQLIFNVRLSPLSRFQATSNSSTTPTCDHALRNVWDNTLATVNDYPSINSFLRSNNYQIDVPTTDVMRGFDGQGKRLMAYFKWNGPI